MLIKVKLKIVEIVNKIPILVFALFVVIMGFVVSKGVLSQKIEENAKSDSIKDMALKYQDISNLITNYITNLNFLWGLLALSGILLLFKLYISYFYKEPIGLQVITHTSLNKPQYKLKSKIFGTGVIKLHNIDLTEQMLGATSDLTKLSYVVNEQDSFIKKFMSEVNSDEKLGYMGIAHTPLIMRAGFQVGEVCRVELFHKKRKEPLFKRLENSDFSVSLNTTQKKIINGNKELIVAISTTSEIKDNEMDSLKPDEKSVIKYQASELDFDVITSHKQIDSYVSQILNEVRLIVKDNDIQKVHFAVSSSVVFTFALGQAIKRNSDPESIIYHHDRNSTNKYPWGISIMKDFNECIVTT